MGGRGGSERDTHRETKKQRETHTERSREGEYNNKNILSTSLTKGIVIMRSLKYN